MNFFDLRLPLGWLFVILGVLLEVAGVRPVSHAEGAPLNININLIWGVVMVAFGLICLWLAHRNKRRLARGEQAGRKD